MFGIEREMTLFCGEQVTPCHEHGVSEDEFQEERMVESAEVERRESRVWPSGEREKTGDGREM